MGSTVLPAIAAEMTIERASYDRDDQHVVSINGTSLLVSDATRQLLEFMRASRTVSEVAAFLSTDERSVSADDVERLVLPALPKALFDDRPVVARPTFHLQWEFAADALVMKMARPLAVAMQPFIVTLVWAGALCAAAINAGTLLRVASYALSPSELAIATCLSIVVSFLHEIGHAAACLRAKRAPGRLGIGFYYVFPVFYIDVACAWSLKTSERLLIDAGGLTIDAAVVAGSLFINDVTGSPVLLLLAYFRLLTMLLNMNTVVKLDGYWILSDLFNIPNLHKHVRLMLQGRESPSAPLVTALCSMIISAALFLWFAGTTAFEYVRYTVVGFPEAMRTALYDAHVAVTTHGIEAAQVAAASAFNALQKPVLLAFVVAAAIAMTPRRSTGTR